MYSVGSSAVNLPPKGNQMLKKLLLPLCVAMTCVGSHAATQYNFFFQAADDTQTSGAYILWDGTTVVGGGGSLQDGGFDPELTGRTGTMSNFQGSSLDQFTFSLSGSTRVFAINFSSLDTYYVTNSATNINYPVNASHYANVATTSSGSSQFGLIGYVSPAGIVYEDPTVEGFSIPESALPVPEIDGAKLPQALMLLGGLLLAYRSRRLFKLQHNIAAQAV